MLSLHQIIVCALYFAKPTMASDYLKCQYCGRCDFQSLRGLTQHRQKTKYCYLQHQALFGDDSGYHTAHEYTETVNVVMTHGRTNPAFIAQQLEHVSAQKALMSALSKSLLHTTNPTCAQKGASALNLAQNQLQYMTAAENWSSDQEEDALPMDMDNSEDEVSVDTNADEVMVVTEGVNCTLRDDFLQYVSKMTHNATSYTKREEVCIRLLITLRHTKASLDTYEEIMRWHLHTTGSISSLVYDRLSDTKEFISRDRLFRKLSERYQITANNGQILRSVTLPHSKARPQIVSFDAKNLMIELLTDPRIVDDDYLFFGNDPLQPPPDTLNYVGDLNTGRAYTETYKRLITKPGKQVLLPVIFYIDGANTGQFSDLPITALKFTLGIFNRKARDRDFMWKTLGYVPSIAKFKSRGRRLLIDSGHVDSVMAHPDALDGEGENEENSANKAQDLHTMLDVLWESFVELQKTGFVWDLHYRNKVYKGIEFVLFVPFLKVDGDEGDKLSGKFTSRTGNVANLCRYCECPTHDTDNPLADYRYKTTERIQQLVANNDEVGLRALSQQNITNACYKLRFGLHNARGVHGACPVEMLHALLLGMFRYARDCMFEQLGDKSQLAKDFNALAQEYGTIMMRQSDRNLPKTKFSNGITKGKLMAKEYPGVLLCMVCVLVSTKGRERILTKKSAFPDESYIQDWILLLETLLQWEIWLKSEQMEVHHVQRAKKKHRYIMYLFRKVGNRATGMGLKVSKFHSIVHMADDILNFGVPMEFDTGANESGHKATKKAAKLTQRCEATFDSQTAKRLNEMHLLEIAEQELEGNVAWQYYHNSIFTSGMEEENEQSYLTGSKLVIYYDEDREHNVVLNTSRAKDKDQHKIEGTFVRFVVELQNKLAPYGVRCAIRTELRRNGTIFRANARFREAVWRDWVLVDFGPVEGHLPCKIWGFVDLSDILPPNAGIEHGQFGLEPEIYAIVESSEYLLNEAEYGSDLFAPITKIVGGIANNRVTSNTFLMVTVEAFVKPIAVIPDMGGPPNRYFVIKDRSDWAENFGNWLAAPHTEEYNTLVNEEDG